MIIDLSKPVERSQDPVHLHALLSALIGQPCVRASLSYGGELMLHVGGPIPHTHPRLAGEKKGAWILGVRASGWRLLLTRPPTLIDAGWPGELRHWPVEWAKWFDHGEAKTADEDEIDRRLSDLVGEVVAAVHPFPFGFGFGLLIVFSNGANLVVCPNQAQDEDTDSLADWELFTPYHTYLRCGPGVVWSYLRSDTAEKNRTEVGKIGG